MILKMRKFMTKEVTVTTIKCAKVEMDKNGLPVVIPLNDLKQLGSVSSQKAQKLVKTLYGIGVSIYNIEENTQTYKMEVEKFIEMAELVTEGEETEEKRYMQDVGYSYRVIQQVIGLQAFLYLMG
jgi:hypothetical protein